MTKIEVPSFREQQALFGDRQRVRLALMRMALHLDERRYR
jgi:hypothetical protein